MRAFFVAVAIVLAAGAARADRYRRGLTTFQQRNCAHCHSVGWQKAAEPRRPQAIDLTRAVDHFTDEELRRFLRDPQPRQSGGAQCEHAKLSPREVDDLVRFLHVRATAPPPEQR